MLQSHIEGDSPFIKLDSIASTEGELYAQNRDEYGDIIEDARVIMGEYFSYYAKDATTYVRLNRRRRAEHEFNVEIAPGIELTGKIDALARSNGLRWLVEHKTFTHLPDEDERWRNLQSSVYIRVIDMLGWPSVDGTLWDYIHSKAPSKPKLLKSGILSKKSLNTLPSVVRASIKEHRLDKHDNKVLIAMAEKNRRKYFQRIYTPVKKLAVDLVFADVVDTAQQMKAGHGCLKDRNIDRGCGFCDYEPICRAALQGSDVEYIKEQQFYVSQKSYD